MSFSDRNKNSQDLRVKMHQERLARNADARRMVKEGAGDDAPSRPSALKRLVARVRRSGR